MAESNPMNAQRHYRLFRTSIAILSAAAVIGCATEIGRHGGAGATISVGDTPRAQRNADLAGICVNAGLDSVPASNRRISLTIARGSCEPAPSLLSITLPFAPPK